MDDTSAARHRPLPLSQREPWPDSPLRATTLGVSAWALRLAAGAADLVREGVQSLRGEPAVGSPAADALARWHDGCDWPEQPLRVGLVAPAHWATVLAETPGVLPVRWYALAGDPGVDWTRHGLDALVTRTPDDTLLIETPEHPDREALWYDWNAPRPLSFPAVFPGRLDPARVSLHDMRPGDAPLLRLIVEAAAAFSRHPGRLNLHDRLNGRRPLPTEPARSQRPTPFHPRTDIVSVLVSALVDELGRYRTGSVPTSAERVVSRLVSAWAATWPLEVDDEFRRVAAEAAHRVGSDEPEVMLRVGAVRIGDVDDDAGFDLLLRAERAMRHGQTPLVDQTPFLSGELDAGVPGPRTTGRIAAGIALVASTLRDEQLAYFRDDLTDDLRHANALIGRDQDHALLLTFVRRLGESRGVAPVQQAA